MNTLSNLDEQDVAFEKLIKLRYWRLNTDESEEHIATRRLGFESAEHMYRQLKKWEWPDWAVYKEPPSPPQPKQQPRQSGGTTEEPIELPPAYGAALLFYQALKKLNNAIGDLENRKEYLQDRKFVAWEQASQLPWPEMGIEASTLSWPFRGQQTPHDPLPALIGAYFLADEPLEPLLEKLNNWPETVDKEQIRKLIEGEKTSKGHIRGLKSVAGLIARGVRGGEIRGGQTTGEFSTKIHNGVWYSQELEQRGFTARAISERLKEAGFSPSEISQVQKHNKLPGPL